MPHKHVTVTVDAETVARIEERLDPGETVAHWMRDAAEMRLDGAVGGSADGPDDGSRPDGGDERGSGPDDSRDRRPDRDFDDRGPAYEFVDDCAI